MAHPPHSEEEPRPSKSPKGAAKATYRCELNTLLLCATGGRFRGSTVAADGTWGTRAEEHNAGLASASSSRHSRDHVLHSTSQGLDAACSALLHLVRSQRTGASGRRVQDDSQQSLHAQHARVGSHGYKGSSLEGRRGHWCRGSAERVDGRRRGGLAAGRAGRKGDQQDGELRAHL